MSGIYIHIPFCKQACHYCNFHFSTSLKNKEAILRSLVKEIEMQREYLINQDGRPSEIKSIYFGGGTPSLLTPSEILLILDTINKYYPVNAEAEITLEANPDDLSRRKLADLKETPINRLSIGIQSFIEEDLRFMNRAHSAQEGYRSIVEAREAGFTNLTIDLIYGTPTLSNANWEKNLDTFFSLDIPHLSCYCLTVEDKTALASFVKNKKAADVDEEKAIRQFQILLEKIKEHGFEQYEISNFCKNEMYSQHNSNYWLKENYLGLGPSAHSYNGTSRQWNIANNARYIESINNNKVPCEKEELTLQQRFNEYILTSLRTIWGTDLEKVRAGFGESFYKNLSKDIQTHIRQGHIVQKDQNIYLTDAGKLLTDKITSELFIIA